MTRRIGAVALACAAATAISAGAASAAVSVRGSVEQVQVTGARPGAKLTLVNRRGRVVVTRKAGRLGGAVLRDVPPGAGYRLRSPKASKPFSVMSSRSAPPSTKGYRQKIPDDGYGYLTTRDGTKLAIDVHLPGPRSAGPYPTLIEYSGYGYANPAGGQSSIAQIGTLMGFAVVDVNMRGTGCSGGAFDYFETLQSLDGYDVIETVARQPWALGHRVGMMGISYGGISQLFVAATAPPSLAAITPLSVLDDSSANLYPGGILNTGFSVAWAKERVHDAKPASATGGQAWALGRVKGGDAVCKANQALHADAPDLIAKIHDPRSFEPARRDPLSPYAFAGRIKAPVFLACQWTDEQTGGRCPTLATRFTGTAHKWFTFTNGTHIDSLDPATFNRWFDFLSLYVAHRAPKISAVQKGFAPTIYKAATGIPDIALPDDPIQAQPDYASALAAFEALPPVRVLFDNGAGGSLPGMPFPGFEASFASWPVPGTQARTWWLDAGGALAAAAPGAGGEDAFTWDKGARPATSFTGNTSSGAGGLWTAAPPYRWQAGAAGTALTFTTAPLDADTVVVGGGSVHAWVKATVGDVDLQVTVSEVRPDAKETFVQNGWLRASARKLDPARSDELAPVPSLLPADAAPLPGGRFTELTIPLYYEGHAYRAGSRIRLTISAPSGDQPVWSFAETVPKGTATVTFARGPETPSRLVLPVVPGVTVPTPLPPCPGLRGEPCRDATP